MVRGLGWGHARFGRDCVATGQLGVLLANKADPNCADRWGGTPLQVTSYTLHPVPYTLHLKSDTRHLTPYTLHPTPYSPHPTPFTLHPTLPKENIGGGAG